VSLLDDLESLSNLDTEPQGPARPLNMMEKLQALAGELNAPPPEVVEQEVLKPYKNLSLQETKDYYAQIKAMSKEQLKQGRVPAVRGGQALLATARGTTLSLIKGIFTPVSAFVPDALWNKLEGTIEADKATRASFDTRLMGRPDPINQFMMGTGAELGGYFIPGTGIVKGANAVWQVGKGANLARNMAAGATTGAAFTTFAKHDSGEDRAWGIIRDMALGGVAEVAIWPILHSVTRSELGDKADEVIEAVAASRGITKEAAESEVAALRGGVNTQGVEVAREVEKAAVRAGAENTPLVSQARKLIEAWKKGSGGEWKIDAALPRDYGLRLDLEMPDGSAMPYHIKADPKQPLAFEQATVALKQMIQLAERQGQEIKIVSATAHNQGPISRFVNIFNGRTVRRERPVPDAPPKNSVSETGVVPPVGSKVDVASEGGVIKAEVVATESPLASPAASVPLMITKRMGLELKGLGYSEDAIRAMTPEEAHEVLSLGKGARRDPSPKAEAPGGEKLVQRSAEPSLESSVSQAKVEVKGTPPGDQPPASSSPAAGVPPGHLRVRLPNGQERIVKFSDVRVMVAQAKPGIEFRPHSNGSERRFVLDMKNGDFIPEPLDAPGGWWRSDMFTTEDPLAEFNHQTVKGFTHPDGSITLSVNPVTTVDTRLHQGLQDESGFLDRVENSARTDTKYRGGGHVILRPGNQRIRTPLHQIDPAIHATEDSGSKLATGNVFPTEYKSRSGKFAAGFNAKKTNPQDTNLMQYGGPKVEKPNSLVERSRLYMDVEEETLGNLKPSTARRVSRVIGEEGYVTRTEGKQVPGRKRITGTWRKDPVTGKWRLLDPSKTRVSTLQSHIITAGNSAEAVTLRNAARRLIHLGAPESTLVRGRVAHDVHKAAAETATMTLRDAANLDLGTVPFSSVREEAAHKGYRAVVTSDGVTLESTVTGESRTFAHTLEAMEALGRVPHVESGAKLEGVLEQAWNMGRDRGWDPEVDVKQFVPAEMADVAVRELVEGKRPLITMYTKDIGAAQDTLNALKKIQPGSQRLRMTVLEEGDRTMIAIYDPAEVQKIGTALDPALRKLGVRTTRMDPEGARIPEPPEKILADVHALPDGVDIFKGRDPSDALMYSFFKSKGMKEDLMKGRLQHDAQGPFRTYPPEVKRGLAKLLPC
jgi:hypothetical protein